MAVDFLGTNVLYFGISHEQQQETGGSPIDATTFRDRMQALGVRPITRPEGPATADPVAVGALAGTRSDSHTLLTSRLPGAWHDTPHG
ncbi:MAG TPA: hypothetical protein VM536_19750, partial [Chloroflexia bacterium]|nr:hypothetical protein [Chloroflexia bacterium]